MLSKFCRFIAVNEHKTAVFNSILFKPVIMDEKECMALKNNELYKFNETELNELRCRGIITENSLKDEQALSLLKRHVEECTKNGISLIYIIPSNFCNLACKYCFIGKLDDNAVQEIEFKTIDNIIQKYVAHLRKNHFLKASVVFYGAEPLTAFNKIKYAVEKFKSIIDINWEFSIVTNGTLINDEIVAFFKENNFGVGVSIDGPKDINDLNRIFKYNSDISVYDTIISKLKVLKDNGVSVGLSITLTQAILDNKKKFFEWLKNLGVKDINYNLLHYTSKCDDWEQYYCAASKFLFESDKILRQLNVVDDRLQRKIRAFNSDEFKYNDCGAIGGHQLCFAPNGDITVCHGYWHSEKERCGNINNDSFEDVMETQTFKKWQNNLTVRKAECLNCEAIYMCGGGCAMQSEDLFGDQNNIDRGFCIHTKESLKELLEDLVEQ